MFNLNPKKMANENQSAEALHEKANMKGSQTSSEFVNKGTPKAPLATMADTTNPEVSASASQALRDGLSK